MKFKAIEKIDKYKIGDEVPMEQALIWEKMYIKSPVERIEDPLSAEEIKLAEEKKLADEKLAKEKKLADEKLAKEKLAEEKKSKGLFGRK